MQIYRPRVQFHLSVSLFFRPIMDESTPEEINHHQPAVYSSTKASERFCADERCSAPDCQGHAAVIARQTHCLSKISERKSLVLEDTQVAACVGAMYTAQS